MPQPHEQWAGAPPAAAPPPPGHAPSGPAASVPDPSLTKAGTILLLVGAIVSLAVLVFSIFMAAMMLMMFTWFDQWMPPMFDRDMMPWPSMGGGLFMAMTLFTVVALIVVTVLHFVAWKMANDGDHKRAGILGIAAGSLGLVFASGTGIIGLLGGVFVLMAAQGSPSTGDASPDGRSDESSRPPQP